MTRSLCLIERTDDAEQRMIFCAAKDGGWQERLQRRAREHGRWGSWQTVMVTPHPDRDSVLETIEMAMRFGYQAGA